MSPTTQPPLWFDSRQANRSEPSGLPEQWNNGDSPLADPRFPGILISIGWIVMYFVLQVVVSIPVLVVAALLDRKLRDKLTSGDRELTQQALLNASGVPILLALVLAGAITIAILWLHLRKDGRHRSIGLFARSRLPAGTTVGYGIGLMVMALIVSAIYNSMVLKGKDSQADTKAIIDGLKSPAGVVVGFFAIVVVAPIVEELLFRGYLQTALTRRMKPWMAIAISSAVFGAIHFQPLAFPILALLGAVFGYLYHRTGSLKVNIALHMANNAFAFLALVLAGSHGA
jgi:membrane protease YdiL (CAAX protease family)